MPISFRCKSHESLWVSIFWLQYFRCVTTLQFAWEIKYRQSDSPRRLAKSRCLRYSSFRKESLSFRSFCAIFSRLYHPIFFSSFTRSRSAMKRPFHGVLSLYLLYQTIILSSISAAFFWYILISLHLLSKYYLTILVSKASFRNFLSSSLHYHGIGFANWDNLLSPFRQF